MAGNLSDLLKRKICSTDKRHFEVEAEIPRFGWICCTQLY